MPLLLACVRAYVWVYVCVCVNLCFCAYEELWSTRQVHVYDFKENIGNKNALSRFVQ